MTRNQLIALLAPNYNDRSLDAIIERDFLGLNVPSTPMPMLPIRVVNAPRALRNGQTLATRSLSPIRLFELGDMA